MTSVASGLLLGSGRATSAATLMAFAHLVEQSAEHWRPESEDPA